MFIQLEGTTGIKLNRVEEDVRTEPGQPRGHISASPAREYKMLVIAVLILYW